MSDRAKHGAATRSNAGESLTVRWLPWGLPTQLGLEANVHVWRKAARRQRKNNARSGRKPMA